MIFKSENQIVNLSKYKLTNHEKSLLEFGLNFIPTPSKKHPVKLLQDFFLLERKVKLRYYFLKKQQKLSQSQETEEQADTRMMKTHLLIRKFLHLRQGGHQTQI